MDEQQQSHVWTSCEWYGHNFVSDEEQPEYHYCTDCDEAYYD